MKRQMTKRQVLNALLDATETQQKIDNSQRRICAREEKLNKLKKDLSQQLLDIVVTEKERNDDTTPRSPIVFKNHVFTVHGSTRIDCAYCDVESINSVT